jgi:hypothetical protein
MNVMMMILFCVVLGAIAAIFWPRRNSPEARVFVVTTMLAAAAIALVNAWKRSTKR